MILDFIVLAVVIIFAISCLNLVVSSAIAISNLVKPISLLSWVIYGNYSVNCCTFYSLPDF